MWYAVGSTAHQREVVCVCVRERGGGREGGREGGVLVGRERECVVECTESS